MPPLRRTAAIVLAVLSIVIVTAPALAAPGGNSGASAACDNGGYVNFTDTAGNPFRNEGACVSYAAHGGTLVPVVVGPITVRYTSGGPSVFDATVTGTGLEPLSPYELFWVWPDRSVLLQATTDASGGFVHIRGEQCLDATGQGMTSFTARATLAGASAPTMFTLPLPPAPICP